MVFLNFSIFFLLDFYFLWFEWICIELLLISQSVRWSWLEDFNVEYSSVGFAGIFLGEYRNLLFCSCLSSVLFFGFNFFLRILCCLLLCFLVGLILIFVPIILGAPEMAFPRPFRSVLCPRSFFLGGGGPGGS